MTDIFKHTLNNQDIIPNVLWTLKDLPDVNVMLCDIVHKLCIKHHTNYHFLLKKNVLKKIVKKFLNLFSKNIFMNLALVNNMLLNKTSSHPMCLLCKEHKQMSKKKKKN